MSLAYLAPVEYYAKFLSYNQVFVEQHDNYVKQTYRNRCFIAGPEGKQTLTVPVEKTDGMKCPMRDVRISDHGDWRHLHWNALEAAYNHTPFFEFYKDDFAPFYEKKYEFLLDYDMELCRLICNLLDVDVNLKLTTEYKSAFSKDEHDYRELIHPKKDCREEDKHFKAVEYYQVFREQNGFIPNLSIVDLLFNMGPESILILQKCNM